MPPVTHAAPRTRDIRVGSGDPRWTSERPGRIGQSACLIVLLLAYTLLAGCATRAPLPAPPVELARQAQPDSVYAPFEARIVAAHGADASGFRLLERSDAALRYRLMLIDTARHSLDLQYYVWFGDTVGQLMMSRVIAAADRGVRVRILFDDLNSLLHDMASIEIRDAMLSRIDSHPNIEIRLFNSWRERSLFGRGVEAAADFSRLNRRMHNKQLIADNRTAVIGGRNIGDEYFGMNAAFGFHDLDVLGVGPVARQASAVFDRYWNSDWVSQVRKAGTRASTSMLSQATALEPAAAARLSELSWLQPGYRWETDLSTLYDSLAPGGSVVQADPPSRAPTSHNRMPEAFRALMRSAAREVLITNAYIIPDEVFIGDLHELAARGVQVRILTNSLSSHDVPAVNAHYEKWRRRIIEAGADLHELRADAAVQAELVDLAPLRSAFVGLHTKAMVVDRQKSFVGSMNLDPRSGTINSEMGVIVDSAPLSAELAKRMERDMEPHNSWRLHLDESGALRWRSSAGELDAQPARSFWQRLQNIVFKLFPADYY